MYLQNLMKGIINTLLRKIADWLMVDFFKIIKAGYISPNSA